MPSVEEERLTQQAKLGVLLSLFFPIIGIVTWIYHRGARPGSPRRCWAIAGCAVGTISIVAVIVIGIAVGVLADSGVYCNGERCSSSSCCYDYGEETCC